MQQVVSKHPPGCIILATGDTPRYNLFNMALATLLVPNGSTLMWLPTNSVAEATNEMLKNFLQLPAMKWAWIIGDDHWFPPDIIIKLLDREVDAVIPICLSRHAPFGPTFWKREGKHAWMPTLEELPDHGLVEVWNCGDAGMLVQRHVAETIGYPWYDYEMTSVKSETPMKRKGEDFYFTQKIRNKGFKLYADLDTRMGHMIPLIAIPEKGADGKWRRALKTGPNQWIGYITYTKDQWDAKQRDKGTQMWVPVPDPDLKENQ